MAIRFGQVTAPTGLRWLSEDAFIQPFPVTCVQCSLKQSAECPTDVCLDCGASLMHKCATCGGCISSAFNRCGRCVDADTVQSGRQLLAQE